MKSDEKLVSSDFHQISSDFLFYIILFIFQIFYFIRLFLVKSMISMKILGEMLTGKTNLHEQLHENPHEKPP